MSRISWKTFLAGAAAGAAVAVAFLPGIRGGSARGGGERPQVLGGAQPGSGAPSAAAREPQLSGDYWLALGTVHALRGESAEAEQCALEGLRRGEEPEGVLDLLERLPAYLRAAALAAIRSQGEWAWDPPMVADFLLRAGALEEGFAAAREALPTEARRLGPEYKPLIARMVAADPARADTVLASAAAGWGAEALTQIAELFQEHGASEFVLPWLRRALTREDAAQAGQLFTLLEKADPAAAVVEARRLAEAEPGEAGYWERLGNLLRAAGDAGGAFDAYARAARIDPDEDFLDQLYRLDPAAALPILVEVAGSSTSDEAVGLLGGALLRAGRLEEAEEAYFRAQRLDATDNEWLTGMVQLAPKRALAHLTQWVENFGGDQFDEVVGARANAMLALGDAEGAYEGYLAAIALDKADREWLCGLAKADPRRALEVLEEMRRSGGDEYEVMEALGEAYARLGRHSEAVACLEAAVANSGDDAPFLEGELAQVDPERGIGMLRERLARAPDDADLWGFLGNAYYGLGQTARAVEAYEKALSLDPCDGTWILCRARIR